MSIVARAPGHHHLAGVLFEPTGKSTGSPTGPRTSPGAQPPFLTIGRKAGGVRSEPPPTMISTTMLSTQLAQKFQAQWSPVIARPVPSWEETALCILQQAPPSSIEQKSHAIAIVGQPSSAFKTRLTPITASPPLSQNATPSASPKERDPTAEASLARYESGSSATGEGEMIIPPGIALPKVSAPPEKKKPPYPLDPITAKVWQIQKELWEKYPHLADLDRSTGPSVDNRFNFKGLPESNFLHAARH